MQAALLFSSATGRVVSCGARTHARVRLLVDRLGDRWRARAGWFSDLLTLMFFAALLVGSGWIAVDLWGSHEQSELLGVPWKALRLIANASLLAACAILAWRLIGKRR
jgi:TRAP-type C4-dicarboxylate transport system permease small subunit